MYQSDKRPSSDQTSPGWPPVAPLSFQSSPMGALNAEGNPNASANIRAPHMLLPGGGAPRRSIKNAQQFLEKVPIFKRLAQSDLPQIAQGMEIVSFPKDTIIFNQGDKGDAFYIIQNGEADVLVQDENALKVGDKVQLTKNLRVGSKMCEKHTKAVIDKFDTSREYPYTIRAEGGPRGRVLAAEIEPLTGPPLPKFVATLRPEDYFGEQSLLKNCHRAATIKSRTPLSCFMLTREKFKSFRLAEKLNFAKRKAVVAQEDEQAMADQKAIVDRDHTKTPQEMALIKTAIKNNKNLSQIIQMDEDKLARLADCAYKMQVPKDTIIIQQGEIFADKFYVVQSGEFSFHVKQVGNSETEKISQQSFVGLAREFGSFGELALLYHAPRAATVVCSKEGVVFVIDRLAFKHVLMAANDKKMQDYLDILNNVELLSILMADERSALAEALVEVHYIKGETIIKQGAQGNAFYILYDGDVDVRKNGEVVGKLSAKATENKAHTFGERALLKDEPRAASIIVTSDEAHVLALTRDHFEHILGPLEEIMLETASADKPRRTHLVPALGKAQEEQKKKCQVELADLRRIGLLGCGGFGAVTLELHKQSGEAYALKQLSKGYILKMRTQKGVLREKEIMSLCNSPFIIKLYKTFKSKDHLYFLLEPALGGELFALYHKYRFHGSVSKARFYAAAVVFSFEHLHERNVIYRDLKPENLLLDVKGYCKVTDMGLAKIVIGKTYTTCGTPDYFAPEVVQHTGMTKAVDWWTLGVLVHELLSGHAPFEAKDPMETYQKIVRGVNHVTFVYKDRDPKAVDLVQNLLKHAPNERLPIRVGGVANLKNHSWYKGFDWKSMANLQMAAPFVPKVRGPTDISNFKVHESDMPPQIPYVDPGTGWDDDF